MTTPPGDPEPTGRVIKALTVRPPWSSAVIYRGKDVENRTQPTKHRGLLAIHAGLRWDKDAVEPISNLAGAYYIGAPHGAIIGTVEVVGCHSGVDCAWSCSVWALPDHHHWVLANPKPLSEPIPCKGALGLWNVPADIAARIEVTP